jgi:methylenetetrahydrofolate reductase (NADPH)
LSSFRQSLESGHFAITAELTPPRGADPESLTVAAGILKSAVTAVNVTDGAGARVRMSSLAAAIHLRQAGMEPIMQMTCRDRNRIAMQSDLLGAAAFGITNVLVLTGDKVAAGDDPEAKEVFDLDSRELLSVLRSISEDGKTMAGVQLDTSPAFFRGAADVPQDPGADWKPDALEAKIAAGAQFVQTQYCYDMALLERYMTRLRDHGITQKLYFLVGLGPLRSARSARWMRDNLWGTVMPDGIIRRMESARDPRQEGIAICAELLRAVREIPGVAGAHLMAPGLHQEMIEAISLSKMI